MKPESQNQLTLFTSGSIVDEAIGKVFKTAKITAKRGEAIVDVGNRLTLQSRKLVAEALNLKGPDNKDKLNAAILEQSDRAFLAIKGKIASLGDGWTLKSVADRVSKNGEASLAITFKKPVNRPTGPTDEQIAEAMGMSVEEVQAARARQLKRMSEQNIDMAQDPARE